MKRTPERDPNLENYPNSNTKALNPRGLRVGILDPINPEPGFKFPDSPTESEGCKKPFSQKASQNLNPKKASTASGRPANRAVQAPGALPRT